MKRLRSLLFVLMIMLCMVACGKQQVVSDNEDKRVDTNSPTSSELQGAEGNVTAPDIDATNLDDYLPGLWSDYKCSVSEPVVEDERAIYTIELSCNGRFASMTGSYEMVLVQISKNEWRVDTDSCRWIDTVCSLNESELFSAEYYWAAYPLTPAKSDPVYFVITNISDDDCTIEWWSPEYENSKLNDAYDGTVTTSICMVDADGLGMPRWEYENIEISSLKNRNNPISFTLQLTPDDFMIVPSDESAKYVGAYEIKLSRIKNEQYYSDLVVNALHDDAHREMIELGADELWQEPELVWRTSGSIDSSVWIDSLGYAGSIYLTGDGTRNNSLYILYGMEIGFDCPGTYCPKYGVMYYAVEFTDVKAVNGVLAYDDVKIEPFNDSATAPILWIKGGYTDLYMYGSTSVAEALDYYQSVFGKVYSLEYIAPNETSREYLDYLECIASGKIGLSLDDSLKVVGVTEGGAAEAAGIQNGDVLVAIYECPIGNMKNTTVAELLQGRAETEIELTFLRDGSELTFTVERRAQEN